MSTLQARFAEDSSCWRRFDALPIQVPDIGNFGLIDADTPEDAYTFTSWRDGSEWQLVFSDEFETEGRTFYSGDDPYWEAVDMHYWVRFIRLVPDDYS